MRKDIWATLYHKISTDEKPQHHLCPEGIDSLCDWQKSKAFGNLESYTHKEPMCQEVFHAVKPIYEELSSDDLLERCLGGYTQNANKAFNAAVWSIAPKSKSNGKTILDIAANLAVIQYNDGLTGINSVMRVLHITIGSACYNFCLEADAMRIKLSERSLTDAAKEARRSSTSSRKQLDEENFNLEG